MARQAAGMSGFDFSHSMVVVTGAGAGIGEGNCIAPGYIKVDSGTSPPKSDFETALIKNTPWGRLGTPADIAQAALFLASRMADYVTGEVLAVNGGAFAGRMYLPLSTPIVDLASGQTTRE